jgi:hypothetical protein
VWLSEAVDASPVPHHPSLASTDEYAGFLPERRTIDMIEQGHDFRVA